MADLTLPSRPGPAWQKMGQSPLNDTTQPVYSEEEEMERWSGNWCVLQTYV